MQTQVESIENIVAFYQTRYEGNEFVLSKISELAETDHDSLRKSYQRALFINKEETRILNEGIVTCRVNYYDNTDEEIISFMEARNMYTYEDNSILMRIRNGNQCITNVPLHFANIIAENFNVKLDYHRHIIGKQDVDVLNVGDKVEYAIRHSIFGEVGTNKGTVHSKDDDSVTIRLYRSRTKGIVVNVGEEISIRKVEKF